MGVGLRNKSVGFIIQARMKSTRLPGKVLMNIPLVEGKPLLFWITDELKKSSYDSEIIIATSKEGENDILEYYCMENKIRCYRGDEEDVLSRFIGIANESNFDCIVRLTADNPIVDIELLNKTIDFHFANENDYTCTSTLPLGMNFEVISSKSILELNHKTLTESDKEHVTLYIKNNDNYRKGVYSPQLTQVYQNMRLTIDYPSDFLTLATILHMSEVLNKKGIQLIDFLFSNYPFIFEANNENVQKRQFLNIKNEIEYSISILQKMELNRVVDILKDYNKSIRE